MVFKGDFYLFEKPGGLQRVIGPRTTRLGCGHFDLEPPGQLRGTARGTLNKDESRPDLTQGIDKESTDGE